MRKISRRASYEFWNGGKFNKSNTKVVNGKMFLFGNCIAEYIDPFEIKFTMGGHPTVTTRERLNTLGIPVRQVKSEQYIDGYLIDPNKWYRYETMYRRVTPWIF